MCWQCGEAGHFQRECPQGPVQSKDTHTIAALKGKYGYKGGYGKHNKGKYGKGKGSYGKGKNNWYRAPGKAIGKGGINYHGYNQEDEYYNAWGYEEDNWNYGIEDENYNGYYLGNVAMLPENDDADVKEGSGEDEEEEIRRFMNKSAIDGRDSLRGTKLNKPSYLHNKFEDLECEDTDSDDDEDDDDRLTNQTTIHKCCNVACVSLGKAKHKPNKRQRQRQRQEVQKLVDNVHTEHCQDDQSRRMQIANDARVPCSSSRYSSTLSFSSSYLSASSSNSSLGTISSSSSHSSSLTPGSCPTGLRCLSLVISIGLMVFPLRFTVVKGWPACQNLYYVSY